MLTAARLRSADERLLNMRLFSTALVLLFLLANTGCVLVRTGNNTVDAVYMIAASVRDTKAARAKQDQQSFEEDFAKKTRAAE
jgi:hypothetical protein